jgi:hypothetical protein
VSGQGRRRRNLSRLTDQDPKRERVAHIPMLRCHPTWLGVEHSYIQSLKTGRGTAASQLTWCSGERLKTTWCNMHFLLSPHQLTLGESGSKSPNNPPATNGFSPALKTPHFLSMKGRGTFSWPTVHDSGQKPSVLTQANMNTGQVVRPQKDPQVLWRHLQVTSVGTQGFSFPERPLSHWASA